jgi:hypothetical protein
VIPSQLRGAAKTNSMRKHLAIFVLALVAFAADTRASTTYFDGGTHTISGLSADISLSNGTTLNVVNGAAINAPTGFDGVGAYDSTAHVSVTGGTIAGGSNPQAFGGFANSGIGMVGGTLNIGGGTLTGGNASFVPGSAINTRNTQITISSGIFHGGDISTSGYAGNAVVVNGGSLHISGGSFFGGNGYLAGIAISLAQSNAPIPAYALITGGTFTAGSGLGFGGFSPFSLAIGYNGSSTMDLKGGQFFGGFYLEDGSILNVYGHGLTTSPITNGKHIVGTLLDGTPLSVDAFLKPTATVNLVNVPEPSTLVLAAFGLGGLVAMRRRRPLAR